MTSFDVDRVRAAFPALAQGVAHFDGPGGSQTPAAVADAVARAMTSGISNRGTVTESEQRAEAAVRDARTAMAALLDNLELLAKRDLAALRKACGVDDEDLREMIAEVRALTPRPGAAFGGDPVQPAAPDVLVREGAGGLWHVELNTDTLPRLLIDQRYHARVSAAARSDQEKTFVADCQASANWLVKSLDQRAKTILKVASEIVRQQDGFLAFGVEHLRPLNLKTVADAIGMHESTVSRVTSNKYMSTPRGVFELKFFFTSAIASADGGEAHSAESVRHKIRQLIDAEHAAKDVLSDDRIVEILKEAGVDIARRTVAKYREAMRIPSSVERRRILKEAC